MVTKRAQTEKVRQLAPIRAAGEVSRLEVATGIALLAFAAIVPIGTMWWWGRPSVFAEFASMIILGIYIFAVIATFAIIFLWGLGRLVIPDSFMRWLGLATVGEIAGLLAYVLQSVFRSG